MQLVGYFQLIRKQGYTANYFPLSLALVFNRNGKATFAHSSAVDD